jgi:hypothetical protein
MLARIQRVLLALSPTFVCLLFAAQPGTAQCLDWVDGLVPPAGGLVGAPTASVTFDDGTGSALYVTPYVIGGGTTGIGRWDGSTWTAVGGATNQDATCFAIYDDGSGAALYVGGAFTQIGGTTCNRIAKWTGTTWASVGAGALSPVQCMCAQQHGSTPGLYVYSGFALGGPGAAQIARWDGSQWNAAGGAVDSNGSVRVLAAYDAPAGPRVIAAGTFSSIGAATVSKLAQWDGATWSSMATSPGPDISAMHVHDFGAGPKLYVGGAFTALNGTLINNVASWDGTSWSSVGSGTDGTVTFVGSLVDANGPALHVGGSFFHAGGIPAVGIARFDGSSWSALGAGITNLDGPTPVAGVTTTDDGSGPLTVVTGGFTRAGGKPSTHFGIYGVACQAPYFLHQPTDETAVFNLPIHFDVQAGGVSPITYQWRHDGVPVNNIPGRIEGATTAHMTIYLWSFNDAGSYDVVATNSIGSTPSNAATLTVPAGGVTGLPITLTDVLRPPAAAVGLAAGEMLTGILDAIQSRTGEFVILGTITGNDRGLFLWQLGTTTLIARERTQAPGLPAGIRYHQFGEFLCADNGTFGFQADLEGTGTSGPSGIAKAYFLHDSQGTSLVAALQDAAPGAAAGAVFSNFLNLMAMGVGGQMSFCSQTKIAGVYNGNGLWWFDRINGLVPVAIDGEASPIPGRTYHFLQNQGVIDPQGNITFEARLDDDSGALLHGVPGSLQNVLAFGDPMPGFPSGTTSVGGGITDAMNANGDLVIASATTDPVPVWAFYSWSNGAFTLLVQKGDPVPGVPSSLTFAGIQPIAMNNLGHVLFRGTLQGSCSGTCPTFGLWLWTQTGVIPVCFNRGTSYPEIPAGWELDSFNSVALNDADEVMLGARFYTGQYFSACYGWTQVSGLFPMAIPGTQVETDPGVFGTVSGAGTLSVQGGSSGPLASSSFTANGDGAFIVGYTTVNGGLCRAHFNSLLGLYFACPMIQAQPPGVVLAVEGQDVTLTASASGGGFLDYRWSHESIDIFDNGHVTGTDTDTLTIHAATTSDYGSYALRVSNICGLDESNPSWVETGPGVAYCFGDGSGTACPCGNASAAVPPAGCQNSLGVGGSLRGYGSASLSNDTLAIDGRNMPDGAVLYFQGTTQVNLGSGVAFGDGLRCAGGSIIRLATKTNHMGGSVYPSGDPAISVKGNITVPGSVRTYQAWYRNAAVFCTSALYNLTNGYVVTWSP